MASPALAYAERRADEGMMAIVPGRFDEHAAEMSVAGLGNTALGARRAAGVLGRHEADERHGAWRGGKAAGVAEFGGDGERGQIIDAAEAAQTLHASAQRVEIQQGAQLGFDVMQPGEHFIDRTQVGAMGLIQRRQWPRLGPQPRVMPFGPRLLGRGEASAVAKEELREAVPGAKQIGADVLTTAEEIPRGLFLLGRNVNGCQCAGPIQHGEVPGIASIGLDAITGTSWDERRRDDVAGNLARLECPSQLEAARPCFVATGHSALPAQPVDDAEDRRTVRRQRVQRRSPMSREQDRGDRRRCMLIESNDGSRLHHDRPPLYAALR